MKKDISFFRYGYLLLWCVVIIFGSFFGVFLWQKGLFAITYIPLLLALLLVISAISFIWFLQKKHLWAGIIILLISLGILGICHYHVQKIFYVLNHFQDNAHFEEKTFVIASLKNKQTSSIALENGKKIAYASIDEEHLEAIQSSLRTQGISLQWLNTSSYQEVYRLLVTGEVELVLLNQSFYEFIDFSFPNFLENIHFLYEETINTENRLAHGVSMKDKDVLHIYFSGIDTYGNIASVSRSDVNIIMSFHRKTNRILLTTIPRDSYVHFPLQGEKAYDKLTHAGVLGIEESIAALEKIYGISIDYYVRLNFTSFLEIVDLLGGIEVNNPVAFTTRYGEEFPAGNLSLDAEKALRFARERKSLEGGDSDRGKNQERVLTAILKKMSSPSFLQNYSSILEKLSSSIQTNMPSEMIIQLISEQLKIQKSLKIDSQSIQGIGRSDLPSYLMPDYQLYMVEIDENSLRLAIQKMLELENGK